MRRCWLDPDRSLYVHASVSAQRTTRSAATDNFDLSSVPAAAYIFATVVLRRFRFCARAAPPQTPLSCPLVPDTRMDATKSCQRGLRETLSPALLRAQVADRLFDKRTSAAGMRSQRAHGTGHPVATHTA